MAGLSYLTVQDVLWIHFQLTKVQAQYDAARLEEATYYQYGRGGSMDPEGQAARLLTGMSKLKPFAQGNRACAFVATLAFLSLNGRSLRLADADGPNWLARMLSDPAGAAYAMREGAIDSGCNETGSPQEAVLRVLAAYPETVRAALEADAAAQTA